MSRVELPVEVEPLDRALLDGVRSSPRAKPGEGERVRLDLGLVPVFSEERPLLGLAGLMDWRGCGRLSALFRSGFGSASFGEQLLLPCDRRLPVARLVLVGLGPRAAFDDARTSEIAQRLVGIARGLRAKSVLLALPSAGIERNRTEALFAAFLGALQDADEISVGSDAKGDADGSKRDTGGAGRGSTTPAPASRWWIAVDEAVVARLRRVLAGPPRAARGTGLHT